MSRAVLPSPAPNAVRQALGLAPVDTNIGVADAAPLNTPRLRVAPHRERYSFLHQRAPDAPSHTSKANSSLSCCVAPSVSPV